MLCFVPLDNSVFRSMLRSRTEMEGSSMSIGAMQKTTLLDYPGGQLPAPCSGRAAICAARFLCLPFAALCGLRGSGRRRTYAPLPSGTGRITPRRTSPTSQAPISGASDKERDHHGSSGKARRKSRGLCLCLQVTADYVDRIHDNRISVETIQRTMQTKSKCSGRGDPHSRAFF